MADELNLSLFCWNVCNFEGRKAVKFYPISQGAFTP